MSDVATMSGGASNAGRIETKRLITFIAMCFGMFMAFLDIQIVASSLAEIQAGLSASAKEISWVQTSYLIAEVISIPLSTTCRSSTTPRYWTRRARHGWPVR